MWCCCWRPTTSQSLSTTSSWPSTPPQCPATARYTEPVFVNVSGAQESIRQPGGLVRQRGLLYRPQGWESIPGLLKRLINSGSAQRRMEERLRTCRSCYSQFIAGFCRLACTQSKLYLHSQLDIPPTILTLPWQLQSADTHTKPYSDNWWFLPETVNRLCLVLYRPGQSLVSDIPAGDGKIANLFYCVYSEF